MRILVLGGTLFLSREIVQQAVDAGHTVTVAARGSSGAVAEGARHVRIDRSVPGDIEAVADRTYDAVIDIARRPSWVRDAVTALGDRASHWTFVSSCSVYADEATPGQRSDAPLREPAPPDADETDMELYGSLKVSCEHAVLDRLEDRAFLCRPGLIVGPGDPSGRFTYWPDRLAAGGTVVAPGSPEDLVQIIDVRDVAAWIITSAESGLTGAFDAISAPLGRGELLAAVSRGVDSDAEFEWVPQDFLLEHDVTEWVGPRSLPLWVTQPEYAGFQAHDPTPALAAGLPIRPFEESARDTLDWLRSTPDAKTTGLTRDEEAELLAAWRARSGA